MKYFIDVKNNLMGSFEEGKFTSIKNIDRQTKIGSVYRGRVKKILSQISAAFIDIGFKEDAYLSLSDVEPKDLNLKEGMEILVQIKKVMESPKGHRVTMEISVGGKYVVLFFKKFKKYSGKLNKDEIGRLGKINLNTNRGILFRTAAGSASEEEILTEVKELEEKLKFIDSERNFLPVPKLIYEENEVFRFIKDNCDKEILVNDAEMFNIYKNLGTLTLDKNFSILHDMSLSNDYKNLFEKTVKLPSGGDIVIEKTTALCSIDVNSQDNLTEKDMEETAYRTNIEAAEEGARQLILRNISGIIFFDFINMKDDSHREKLLQKLAKSFEKDGSKTFIHGYTNLGLVEVSRKNYGEEIKC